MTLNRPARERRQRATTILLLLMATTFIAGCINNKAERGVEPRWLELGSDAFVVGTTTRNDVLQQLGAPSQIVSLDGGTALYYVLEQTVGKGLILFLYNQRKDVTTYSRSHYIRTSKKPIFDD